MSSKTITATFRIVTPMFLGDWQHGVGDGIRPPSVKGALRFWWRALNWKTALKNSNNDENKALKWLHKEEARLFGAAAGDNGSGQGVFLLNVTIQPIVNDMNKVSVWPSSSTGSGYMGFGLLPTRDTQHKVGIKEDLSFEIKLVFKTNATDDDIGSIRETVKVFGMLGGLGSRARRGFGSVSLEKLDGTLLEMLQEENYKQKINEYFTSLSCSTPPFTAFSSNASCRFFQSQDNARAAHNFAGLEYKNYRGQASTLRGRAKIPFGLPLQGVSNGEERRSSPLFFHVHEVKENNKNKYIALAYYLPSSSFHPNYENVNMQVIENFIGVRQ